MTGYRLVRAVISTLLLVFYLFTLQSAPSGAKSSHTESSPAIIVGQNSPSKANIDPTYKTKKITITIVYDNNEYDKRLETAWGFSCLVQGLEKTILFDTGGDGSMLTSNMRKLGIDPQVVDVVVISHIHYDHVGGLPDFLKANHNVSVYLPEYIPKSIKDTVRESGAHLIEVSIPVKICRNVYSTGKSYPGQRRLECFSPGFSYRDITLCAPGSYPHIYLLCSSKRAVWCRLCSRLWAGFHCTRDCIGCMAAIMKRNGGFRKFRYPNVVQHVHVVQHLGIQIPALTTITRD